MLVAIGTLAAVSVALIIIAIIIVFHLQAKHSSQITDKFDTICRRVLRFEAMFQRTQSKATKYFSSMGREEADALRMARSILNNVETVIGSCQACINEGDYQTLEEMLEDIETGKCLFKDSYMEEENPLPWEHQALSLMAAVENRVILVSSRMQGVGLV